MSRSRLTFVLLLVLLGAGGATWWALHQDDLPASAGVAKDAEFVAPTVGTVAPVMQHVEQHDAWPYMAFVNEISMLREPVTTDPESEFQLQKEVDIKIFHAPVTLKVEKATLREIVDILTEQAGKKVGVKVWVYDDDHEVDDVRFTLDFEDIPIENLIDELRGQSDERMKYYTTHQGLVFGGVGAIQRAQIEAREALAQKRSKRDRDDPLLDASFRPDFEETSIMKIHRLITSQTGVQVVVDGELWRSTTSLTWRDKEMPLRDALDVICKKFKCHYRVHQGRVFLLSQ